jgi:hypothetical protein
VNTTPVGFRPRGANGSTGVTTPTMDRRPVGKVDARPRYNPLIGDTYRRTANPNAPGARRAPESGPQVDAGQPRIREGGSAPDAPRVSSGGGSEGRRSYGGTYSAPSGNSGGSYSPPRRNAESYSPPKGGSGGGRSYSPPSRGGGGSSSAPKGGGGGRGMSGGKSAPSSHGGSGGRRR